MEIIRPLLGIALGLIAIAALVYGAEPALEAFQKFFERFLLLLAEIVLEVLPLLIIGGALVAIFRR